MPRVRNGVVRRRAYKRRNLGPTDPTQKELRSLGFRAGCSSYGWSISMTPARARRVVDDMRHRGISGQTAWIDAVLDVLERERRKHRAANVRGKGGGRGL